MLFNTLKALISKGKTEGVSEKIDIFYAVGKKKKYMHSIFHFFVLAASILFFFSIFLYVI